jgi:hypothetical protein
MRMRLFVILAAGAAEKEQNRLCVFAHSPLSSEQKYGFRLSKWPNYAWTTIQPHALSICDLNGPITWTSEDASYLHRLGIEITNRECLVALRIMNDEGALVILSRLNIGNLRRNRIKFIVPNANRKQSIRGEYISIDGQTIGNCINGQQIATTNPQDSQWATVARVAVSPHSSAIADKDSQRLVWTRLSVTRIRRSWVIGWYKPAMRWGFFGRSWWNEEEIANDANDQHSNYRDTSSKMGERSILNTLEHEPCNKKPPKTLVRRWPNESQIKEEPQSERERRSYDLAYVLYVITVFVAFGLWRLFFAHRADRFGVYRLLIVIAGLFTAVVWVLFVAH